MLHCFTCLAVERYRRVERESRSPYLRLIWQTGRRPITSYDVENECVCTSRLLSLRCTTPPCVTSRRCHMTKLEATLASQTFGMPRCWLRPSSSLRKSRCATFCCQVPTMSAHILTLPDKRWSRMFLSFLAAIIFHRNLHPPYDSSRYGVRSRRVMLIFGSKCKRLLSMPVGAHRHTLEFINQK